MNKKINHARVTKNNTFEDQLADSAHRLRMAQDANLTIKASPLVNSRPISNHYIYWSWITTPIAAVVGLLIGIFINQPKEDKESYTVPVVVTETSGNSILDDGIDYSLFVTI